MELTKAEIVGVLKTLREKCIQYSLDLDHARWNLQERKNRRMSIDAAEQVLHQAEIDMAWVEYEIKRYENMRPSTHLTIDHM